MLPADGSPPNPEVSATRLRDVILASGLLDETQLVAVEADARMGGGLVESIDPRGFDKAVAQECVRKKLLTKFQARELLAGRRRFTLGQYRVLDEIGRGGMGQVFKAEHVIMKRIVAVKVLPVSKANPRTEAAFQKEIQLLGKLDHENIVRALDAGYDGNVHYLVTEYVPGIDLRRQISRHGPLDQQRAVAVIVQAARGLAYAHRHGFVHRDVKPGNILVNRDGRVRVLDLGLAGSLFDQESMRDGQRVGTPGYMAPEQIRSPHAVGPAADVFGLGCSLFYALSGHPPFPGNTREEKELSSQQGPPKPLQTLAPHVDKSLVDVVEAMMRPSSSDRIRSADEVMQRLGPWLPTGMLEMPRGARKSLMLHAGATSVASPSSGLGSGSTCETGSRSDALPSSETPRFDDRAVDTDGGGSHFGALATGRHHGTQSLGVQAFHAGLLALPMSLVTASALGVARVVFPGWGPSPFWGGSIAFLIVTGGLLARGTKSSRRQRS